MSESIEDLPDDVEALRAALLAERRKVAVAQADAAIVQAQLADAQAIIEDLKLRIAKARQAQWGQSSERQKHLIDQMELQLEDLVASATEDEVAAENAVSKAAVLGVPVERFTRKKPARAPLPDHLPRRRVVVPPPRACTCCQGSRLRKIGESVTETREVVPRQWIVVQTVREKFVCRTARRSPSPRRHSTRSAGHRRDRTCWPWCCSTSSAFTNR